MSGSTSNQPRLRALVNGSPVGLALSAHVTDNNFYRASTFEAAFAYDTARPGAAWFDPAVQATGQAKLPLEIQMATSAPASSTPSWVSVIQGQVDRVRVDPVTGDVHVSGRDFTARLLDLRIAEAFPNQTASQAIATLAARAGLSADVTQTSTLIGHYYQIDHTALSHGSFSRSRTAWEFMCALARHEGPQGFDLWVDGQTVHFHPASTSATPPYPVTVSPPGSPGGISLVGADTLELERVLTLDKRIKVVVRSWNPRQKRAYTATFPKGAASDAEEHPFVRPGWTAQQCEDFASRRYFELVRLARRATLTMPGELALSPRQRLSLAGTGLSWDGTYFIDSVTREIDANGFGQSVSITNMPPTDGALL